jgi:hypothetical protein
VAQIGARGRDDGLDAPPPEPVGVALELHRPGDPDPLAHGRDQFAGPDARGDHHRVAAVRPRRGPHLGAPIEMYLACLTDVLQSKVR